MSMEGKERQEMNIRTSTCFLSNFQTLKVSVLVSDITLSQISRAEQVPGVEFVKLALKK